MGKNQEYFCGSLSNYRFDGSSIECISTNGVFLWVRFLSHDICRFRFSTKGYFDSDFSYATDPGMKWEEIECGFEETSDYLEITTSSIKCRIEKTTLRVGLFDLADQLLCVDEKGFHWQWDQDSGNDIVKISKQVQEGELYYGLGDKPMDLNLKGKRLANWGTDAYGYERGRDPLYKNIPFYYGLTKNGAYGLFFDNSFQSFFDFGKERPEATSFWAQGGEMNYYFIAGPVLLDVARRYTNLTGRPEMPPMWALGFQQCKWSYYPEKEVRMIARQMRDNKVPCDAIYLDIDYMDGFRCFTWDKGRFPNPKMLVNDLEENGFKTVVIIDPGIKIDPDYEVFKDALSKGFYCRRPDGPFAEGIVWPGACLFPDFTNPEVREWWTDLFRELIGDIGVAGVWNDMNEPALFEVEEKTFPLDVRHDYDGHPCSHRKAHNVYGMQMARATYHGVRKYNEGNRPLIITRSGYAGMQRFTSAWTGDNLSTWDHILLANIQCQRMAVSGVSFIGSDIGGFVGKPSPEMFVRWIQLGIFHPFCRVHSSQDDGNQEPWSFGPMALNAFRSAIELRYRLLPYHYTAFYQYHHLGTPVLKPLSFVDQYDPETHHRNEEFLCGDHILTSSISEPGKSHKAIYLPKGQWYDYWNNELYTGMKLVNFPINLDQFPVFIKAGAMIPHYPLQQYVDEKHFEHVTLKVYYTPGEETSYLYEDDHNSYEYRDGEYSLSKFHLTGTANSLSIRQLAEGRYKLPYNHFVIDLIGLPFSISTTIINGELYEGAVTRIPVDFLTIEWK